jgi:hypothetical protein
MNAKDLKELLEQTLTDSDFETHDAGARRAALREFRKNIYRRKLATISGIAAAVVPTTILLIGSFRTKHSSVAALPPPVMEERAATQSARAGRSLSDAQLLAVFPPGSCYFAEVEGQKVLVFKDEKVRQMYFN